MTRKITPHTTLQSESWHRMMDTLAKALLERTFREKFVAMGSVNK